jgi:hypothetical protein
MNNVICDSCKKVIPGAKREVNYITFQNKALCTACTEAWDQEVREEMGKKGRYSLQDYKETMKKVILKKTR